MTKKTEKKVEKTAEALTKPGNTGSAGLTAGGAFGSVQNFEAVQRMAKMFSDSDLVPEAYRGKVGNCVIALEMAHRLGTNVLAAMQNMYLVHGKPAWSSQFLVACVNASGRFSPLHYRMLGEEGTDTWGCVAWATDRETKERLESPPVTIGMAKAEGWYQKNGSKWKTMPQLMLCYRAATLFARLYAPELTMGMRTEDEIIDITPLVCEPAPKAEKDTPAETTAAPGATNVGDLLPPKKEAKGWDGLEDAFLTAEEKMQVKALKAMGKEPGEGVLETLTPEERKTLLSLLKGEAAKKPGVEQELL